MKSVAQSDPPRAAIYVRVSTVGQKEEGYSLEGQLVECRRFAAELGATVVLEREEVGSGADWRLPQLLDLLERARVGEYDILICLATSRLARDLAKLAVVERQLKRAGIAVRYVQQSDDDTPAGRFSRNIMGAVDEYERENIALRFALGKRAKVARGLPIGDGKPPFGFVREADPKTGRTVGYAIQPDEAAIVRRLVAALRSDSAVRIAERFTAEGIPSPNGARRWSANSVHNIINNPIIYGEYRCGRRTYEKRADGRYKVRWRSEPDGATISLPPIVSRADVEAARSAMERRKRGHGPRRLTADRDPFTLRGLLQCSQCDGQLSAMQTNGVRYYFCGRSHAYRARLHGRAQCDLGMVNARQLEANAWDLVGDLLLNPARLREGLRAAEQESTDAIQQAEQVAILADEIATRRKRLDNITLLRVEAEPGGELERSFRETSERIAAEIKHMQRRLEELQRYRPLGFSGEAARALSEFAERIRRGIEVAGPPQQREIYRLLQLQAALAPDPRGDKIGRRHFWINWRAIIELRDDHPRLSNRRAGELVAEAVCAAAHESGVARRERKLAEGS